MRNRRGLLCRVGVLTPLAVAGGAVLAALVLAADTKPSAPRSVNASPGPASAEVSWKPPKSDGGAKIDAYKIVRSAPGEPKETESVSGRKLSLAAGQLTPGTAYTFKVLAHNKRGWSKGSKAVDAVPLAAAGFGDITGTCGVVQPELDEPTPSLFENRLDFGADWFDAGDRSKLTDGGKEVYDSPSGGGSSGESEIMSYEILDRCEGASLLKTEAEIVYEAPGAITDLLVEIGGEKVGIAVTRLYAPGSGLDQTAVTGVITDKLEDIQASTQNVSDADAWVKQVLVVLAYDDAHADKTDVAWASIGDETKADTVLYLVTTDGSDGSIYCSPDGPTCP